MSAKIAMLLASTVTAAVAFSGDLSTGSYASKSLNVFSDGNNLRSICLNSDGTKEYHVGGSTNNVSQRNLSTGYDISTGGTLIGTFSHGTQQTTARAVARSTDGSKMYVSGNGNIIYQYTLSTPDAASSGTYASKSLDVSAQIDNEVTGLCFNSAGTTLYVAGVLNSGASGIFQYTLSTPWDISTGSYASKSKNTSAQTGANVRGVYVSPDETKMYTIGLTSKKAYQYTQTAGDVSTASYASKSLDLSNEDNSPEGFTFSPDGTKFYMAGNANGYIFEYTLS